MDGAGGAALSDSVLGVLQSVSGRRWRWRGGDAQAGQELAERLGLPEIVGRLLAQRGIELDHAPGFLQPRLRDQLPDPSHLRDMDAAAARLVAAVRDGETIAIFGDYDVDGATSAALLTRFFAAVGARTRIYVPDRLREGYGPNGAALLRLHAEGAKVVVTVDCGTTAHLPLAAAADSGLDIIVVDHHVAEPLLPRGSGGDQSEPARRRQSPWRPGGGRRRLSARRSRSIARCVWPAGMLAAAPSPICLAGSISWRSARCATSSR